MVMRVIMRVIRDRTVMLMLVRKPMLTGLIVRKFMVMRMFMIMRVSLFVIMCVLMRVRVLLAMRKLFAVRVIVLLLRGRQGFRAER